MSDYSELKRLAEAAIKEGQESGQRWPQDDDWFEPELCSSEMYFVKAASPSAVLALIAENEALQKSYAEAWEKARALQSECDEFARDAERYRWLRAQHWDSSAICCVVDPKLCTKLGSYCPSLELLDQAVDAGLKLSKESPNG